MTLKEAAEISGMSIRDIRELCWSKAIRHLRTADRSQRPAAVLTEDALAMKGKSVVYVKNAAGCPMARLQEKKENAK